MVKIGCVNIDTSHPKAFSTYFNATGKAKYTAVFNSGFRGDDEVEAFMKMNGIEKRCNTLEELADQVDIALIHSCNWDNHLKEAEVFIKKNKPVFIDKPLVGNMKDLNKMIELEKQGAVILGTSALRYAKGIEEFNNIPSEEKGKVLSMYASIGVDEFNYAIHAIEGICGVIKSVPLSVKYIGSADNIAHSYFIKFDDGKTAIFTNQIGQWHPFEYSVFTDKSTYPIMIEGESLYYNMLDKIIKFIETGKNEFEPVSKLMEAVKVMFATKISRDNNGKEIKLTDIPEDYEGFDGNKFEKEYSAAAQKMYI